MKKISIVASVSRKHGGVYQYTHALIEALNEDPRNQYVVFSYTNRELGDSFSVPVRNIASRAPHWMKIIRFIQLATLRPGALAVPARDRKLMEDIDVVIVPFLTPYPHFYMDKPTIQVFHDFQERYFPQFFSLKERAMRWLLNRALAHRAEKIVCHSHFVKTDVLKFTGANEQKVFVVPPFFVSDSALPDGSATKRVRKKYCLPKKFLFYPAHFWRHKNHRMLLYAIAHLRRRKLTVPVVLVGFPKEHFSATMRLRRELKLEKVVRWLGFVPQSEMPCLYATAEALVFPSLFESSCIPIWEAFQHGCPVVVARVCALPEMVGKAGLLFDPFNYRDLADKIHLLWTEPFLRKKLIVEGSRRAVRFTKSLFCTKWREVIET